MTVALLCRKSTGSDGLVWGGGLGVRWTWTAGEEGRGGNGGTAGTSSAKEGAEPEPVVGDLCTGADACLAKLGENTGFSPLPSDSDCGCDGELDLCETEPTVEAGEGGARDSGCSPGAVLGRLSTLGAFNKEVEAFSSFSLDLDPFRLYHLSFPTLLLFGGVGSVGVLPGILRMTSGLVGSWGNEALAGDGMLPDGNEFVETVETASNKGFFSLLWRLILTEGTCRNV
jgi:hypothetical protein